MVILPVMNMRSDGISPSVCLFTGLGKRHSQQDTHATNYMAPFGRICTLEFVVHIVVQDVLLHVHPRVRALQAQICESD